MSGVLLLPVRTDAGTFYRKRIGRILRALVFWSLALPVLYFLYMRCVGAAIDRPRAVHRRSHAPQDVDFRLQLHDTTRSGISTCSSGSISSLSILSAWLERASLGAFLRIVLGIWGATLLLPYVKMLAPALGYAGNYGNMGLYGVCDWNEFGTFYYVSGFAGYLVLAFYLVKFPPAWSWRKTLGICIPAFLVGYLVTGAGYVMMQRAFPGNYAIWKSSGISPASTSF